MDSSYVHVILQNPRTVMTFPVSDPEWKEVVKLGFASCRFPKVCYTRDIRNAA